MKSFFYYLFTALVFILIGWFANTAYNLPRSSGNPISQVRPTPLAKYTIENMAKANINPVPIETVTELKKTDKYTSHEFLINFDPTLTGGETKKVSGLMNIPAGTGPFPVVVMFRGYVDPTNYFIGNGTGRVAQFLAENGFITVAPDFLGYGNSDREAENIFETRFQTYTTALQTLKSAESISLWDKKNLFIWGHSNGGQVALTTLEITGADYPAVLWAPVSKPFPYSILYYTDDASDSGKFLRHETAEFENNYDSGLFSLTNYLESINAPIQLNQGTADEAVPLVWSNLFAKNLKALDKDITYITYPGADHNLTPGWSEAVINTLSFYKKFLK